MMYIQGSKLETEDSLMQHLLPNNTLPSIHSMFSIHYQASQNIQYLITTQLNFASKQACSQIPTITAL